MIQKSFPIRAISLASGILFYGSLCIAQAPQSSPGATGQQTTGQGTGMGAGQNSGMNAGQNAGMNPSTMSGMGNLGQASAMDKKFVSKALQGSMAEVQLGQLTLQKSSNDQVKEFAQKMIDDHGKLSEQMKPVAQQIGVPVPTTVSKKDSKVMAKLQALSGKAYDQAYLQDMVKDHKQDLSDFQAEASGGQAQAVKDAASQGSQVISQHLQMVEMLAKNPNVAMAGQ